ncbi:hypothetical protein DXT76_13125 [Halobacillus trueperi]|uniref:Uncharacterized protein n=1 Tax=Halobacillus trueperi TaxID=156205 RepID=A0A3D8VNI8_9BACI|nr:hypothetical protein [Halobacillus trueperi]RDY70388.1 hypothetical protein DXT76_13125 [Halobacillus trueperi]
MVKFKNFNHFKNYCLKIAVNKEVKLKTRQYDALEKFEEVYDFLEQLKSDSIIETDHCALNKITELYKWDQFALATNAMEYLTKKVRNVEGGKTDIYYLLTSLDTMIQMRVYFNESFINSLETTNKYYPSRLRVLKIEEDKEKLFSLSVDDLYEWEGIFGVYFIYDAEGDLAYIGKSTSCVVTRCLTSVIERELYNFSKIEIRKAITKSDVAIYEAYYISNYKPYMNNDLVFDDFPTIDLLDLDIVKTLGRETNGNHFEYSYKYIADRAMQVEHITPYLGDTIYLKNGRNLKYLMENGNASKHEMKAKAYKGCVASLRKEGLVDVEQIKMGIGKLR